MQRTWLVGLLLVVGCSSDSSVALPPAVQAVVDSGARSGRTTGGDDPWEVFVCHVPSDSQSPVYAGLPLRLASTPQDLATVLDREVSAYFDELSHGTYRPRFSAGGEVTIAANDEPQACVDNALAASSANAHGVIVIADAEHNAGVRGGFANPGSTCSALPCSAATTGRSGYVGAADFSAQWGDEPPMDLVEHEIGHGLGWPHSGYDESAPEPTLSALDVMSNSAAPRDVHPGRRDASATLGINLLAAGWLPPSAVTVVPAAGATVTLSPSSGTSGTRLAVVELTSNSFITVELLSADGFGDHLPATGVAVHLIEGSDSTRRQTPLVGEPPYDDLVTPGETVVSNGWRITVESGWRATIQPAGDAPTVSG